MPNKIPFDEYKSLKGTSAGRRIIAEENYRPDLKMVKAKKPSVMGFLRFMKRNIDRKVDGLLTPKRLIDIRRKLGQVGANARRNAEMSKVRNWDDNQLDRFFGNR